MKIYLDQITDFADSLKAISRWKKSGDPFGHFDSVASSNYVFEFWCYMKLLAALDEHPSQSVKFVKGKKSFPKNPASKSEGWSYFELRDANGSLQFQICAGTGIKRKLAPDSVHHPDISFQINNNDEPTEDDVALIMDAKFQSPFDKKGRPAEMGIIPLKEINDFSHRVNVLKVKDAKTIELDFGTLSALKGNCLLSNAKVNSNHGEACKIDCVLQVGDFSPLSKPTVLG